MEPVVNTCYKIIIVAAIKILKNLESHQRTYIFTSADFDIRGRLYITNKKRGSMRKTFNKTPKYLNEQKNLRESCLPNKPHIHPK